MDLKTYLTWAPTIDRTPEQYRDVATRLAEDVRNGQLLNASLGLAGEVGEVVDAAKKVILYGKPLDRENLKEEAGDVFWYFTLLLKAAGLTFEEVLQHNHDKMEKRYPGGFTEALARERKDKT